MTDSATEPVPFDRPARRGDWRPFLCVTLGLLLFSFWRVPIPGVNEPHYFAKAKHLWDGNWCAGDPFLESSNPHLVFYLVFGGWTRFLSLSATAVLSRIACLAVVAWGWQRLARVVVGHRWAGAAALPVFLVLQSLGNFSGEWLVGGAESKVPSYGFLFWGLACLLEGRMRTAAAWLGLSVAFHPLIGVWGLAAAGWAVLRQGIPRADLPDPARGIDPAVPWTRIGAAAIVLFLTALPGLLPAFAALQAGSAADHLAATHLQVAYRLSHHLDPMTFSKASFRDYGLLLVIWGLLFRSLPPSRRRSWWTAFVLAAVVMALVGVVIGWGPRPVKSMPGWEWRIRLLKFYPFRLADLLVPIAVSFAATQTMFASFAGKSPTPRRGLLIAGLSALGAVSLWIPGSDKNPSRMTTERLRAWEALGNWLSVHAEPDAVLLGIDEEWALKWYAHRAEYVNYKDCPQDAPALVEWNRRRWVLADWKKETLADGVVSRTELAALRARTGADDLIAFRFGPIQDVPVYATGPYRVYRLPD